MTRNKQPRDERQYDQGREADNRIIVVDQGQVLYGCHKKRHAMSFLLGFRSPAAIYKRIATALEVARDLSTYWPADEEFPVIQTERL